MTTFVDIHTHNTLKFNLGVRNYRLGADPNPPQKPFSAGIHPWDAEAATGHLTTLLDLLRATPCVAIGEIGLDKACQVSWEAQITVFDKQLQIAAERGLPVIIHSVRAQAEILASLAHYPTLSAAIFHGFVGSPEQLQELVSRGYFISFGFSALRSPKTIRAIAACPDENIFLESDTEEQNIASLYAAVAEIRGTTIEHLLEEITNNYNRIFR